VTVSDWCCANTSLVDLRIQIDVVKLFSPLPSLGPLPRFPRNWSDRSVPWPEILRLACNI
jgi:hypothetical protein